MQGGQLESEVEADSMENYLNHAKQVNWHIDENEFPKLQELRDLNFDEEFNLYLSALLSKKCPWEEADMQFVNSVWEKNEFVKRYGYIFSGSTLILIFLGFIIGYILNDIIGCFFSLPNPGTAIGYLIVLGILIAIIGFIPGAFVSAIIADIFVPMPGSGRTVNRLRILSDDREWVVILIQVLSIIFMGWLVYSYFLRQWLWSIFQYQGVLSFNYHNLFGVGFAAIFLLIKRNDLIQINIEKNVILIINQNRERMQTVITRANNYKL